MANIIHKLHETLNMVKGFEAGYGSKHNDRLLIKHDNDGVYLVEIRKIGNEETTIKDFLHCLK